ncbi:hypothetical protein F0562_009909 [Nyssa sinensis]|uniref:AAA+ ATPase domain-containing protein n=1 Tax=Nyssa sinensis TaxID=561372 RepID=A0A5J5A082_9ASTE|nr:hypothetical protein F0562_009909 [Nyssa sinensis]
MEGGAPPLPGELTPEIPAVDTKSLTIKIATSGHKPGKEVLTKIVSTTPDSPCNSPSPISPPSSAFVSALQSPYISPRASAVPTLQENPTPTAAPTHPSPPPSYCGSQSDDIPSTSYTPPPEEHEVSDDQTNPKLKIVTCVPVSVPGLEAAPRISFSFPVPRISFAKGCVSPASNAKLRSCDVYIGFHGQNPNLVRFCKWLKSELELQGIACFVADRAKYSDTQSHEIADRVICSVTFGVVVVTTYSLQNHLSLEEISNSDDKECKEAADGLMKSHEFKLETNEGNWRSCVSKTAGILSTKLGRKSVNEKDIEGLEELPFPKNRFFVGREKEMMEIETAFFGCSDYLEQEYYMPTIRGETPRQSEGLADEESEVNTGRERKINLEVGKCKEPKLEAWVEPVIGRSSLKRSKYKKSNSGKYKGFGSSVACINGAPGVGKTELALEFSYRYSHRYKRVLWVGGEAQYFRQNILNLSLNLGLDVSADVEKERGRIRSFEEQEAEAFKRVKRDLFRDMPYLLIIDNLETEKEWWEEKDLHDLIPRSTGGSHVIITTRLSRGMNFDPMQLQPLPLPNAMVLIRGRRKKDYPAEEVEFLGKFDEKLGRSSFGLSVIGSLLSELSILPSALFEAVNQVPFEEASTCSNLSVVDEQFCRSNHFLMKVLAFCAAVLQQTKWEKEPPCLENASGWGLVCPSTNFSNFTSRCILGLARRGNRQPGCWIQFHPITQMFVKRKDCLLAAKAMVQGVLKIGNPQINSDHLWASAFLVFGFKSEPPLVQLKAIDMVLFIKKTALPLAIRAFTTFSRCNSALELLKVCTNVLEEVEKSFVSQIQDWCHSSLCWKKKLQSNQRVDEYVWQDVTLLKATLLETRAKLLLRGGHFDSGEELCRTCISIRTVMLGHNHTQTLAAQETLAKLVRLRSKM